MLKNHIFYYVKSTINTRVDLTDPYVYEQQQQQQQQL